MLQNPHRHRCGRYCEADEIGGDYLAWPRRGVAGDERPVIGDMDGAERTQDSPNKNRAGPLRYKTRPADPFSPDLRYKTLPARSKSPYLARFARAGRTLYRCHQQEAVRGELCTEYKSETGLAVTVHQAPLVWRARRAWLRCPWAAAGRGPASRQRATQQQPRRSHWCGGRRRDRRARAGFEIDHSERSSRVAISRAAGPDGARNTRGATSKARAEHTWHTRRHPEYSGSTQQRARSAAAPRAPHVCKWLTG